MQVEQLLLNARAKLVPAWLWFAPRNLFSPLQPPNPSNNSCTYNFTCTWFRAAGRLHTHPGTAYRGLCRLHPCTPDQEPLKSALLYGLQRRIVRLAAEKSAESVLHTILKHTIKVVSWHYHHPKSGPKKSVTLELYAKNVDKFSSIKYIQVYHLIQYIARITVGE